VKFCPHGLEIAVQEHPTLKLYGNSAVNQPLSNVEKMNSEKPFQEVIYPRGKFFELLERPFDGYFYYSSGGIEMLKLSDTVYSEESLKMLTFPTHKELGQVNFWFGKENVTAYTHYDTSQNLHAMVYGQKTFLLLPPSASLPLKELNWKVSDYYYD